MQEKIRHSLVDFVETPASCHQSPCLRGMHSGSNSNLTCRSTLKDLPQITRRSTQVNHLKLKICVIFLFLLNNLLACGGILTNESGNIISTNDGKICTYVIHVPRGFVIRLSWKTIRSDSSRRNGDVVCDSDFVKVYDNSSTALPSQEIGPYEFYFASCNFLMEYNL